jgi:hypothetical protein
MSASKEDLVHVSWPRFSPHLAWASSIRIVDVRLVAEAADSMDRPKTGR